MENSEKKFDNKIIFVIGAARSGTSLLYSCIVKNFQINYVGEINEIWKRFVKVGNTDCISAECATPRVKKSLREYFISNYANVTKLPILEKTAANSLRPEFIYRVFPEAYFLHIVRDGRDVAISAKKKYQGNVDKISKFTEGNNDKIKKKRLNQLFSVIYRKFRNGLRIKQVICNTDRYFESALCLLGLKRACIWGPRFPGIKKAWKKNSLLEVGALQWKCSVDTMVEFHYHNPDANFMEIKYEELINSSDKILGKVFNFLQIDEYRKSRKTEHDIITSGKSWRDALSSDEIIEVETLIGDTLKKNGYESESR